MLRAAIDLGTNSVRLLVGTVKKAGGDEIHRPADLPPGTGLAAGEISPQAVEGLYKLCQAITGSAGWKWNRSI